MADQEFNYGIRLTFSKGSDLSPQLQAVSRQLNELGRDVGVSAGGPLAKLDANLQRLQARLQALQAQIATHTAQGLDPSDAILKTDVDKANRAILHFTTNIKNELAKLVTTLDTEKAAFYSEKFPFAVATASDANRKSGGSGISHETILDNWWVAELEKRKKLQAQEKEVASLPLPEPPEAVNRQVHDPRLGQLTPEQALAHADALERSKDPMFSRRKREDLPFTDVVPTTSELAGKTAELTKANKEASAANDERIAALREEAAVTAESVTNLRLAQGQVVPATNRPLGPSLSRPGDQSEPTGGLVRPFKRERLDRARYAADQANLQDPGFTEEKAMAPDALAAAAAERQRTDAALERIHAENEEAKPKVRFERPADFNGPTQIVAKDAVEAESKFKAAVEARIAAQKAGNKEIVDEVELIHSVSGAEDEAAQKAKAAPTTSPGGPGTGSRAKEIEEASKLAEAEHKLTEARANSDDKSDDPKIVAQRQKLLELKQRQNVEEKKGSDTVKEGRDVTNKATEADEKRAKTKRVVVEVTGGEAAQNELIAKKLTQTTEAVLKDTLAGNARIKVTLANREANKKEADEKAAQIKANQDQMARFGNVTDQVLSDNDLRLQTLVTELADATMAGGDFEKTLGGLQNRLAKAWVEGDVDLKQLGVDLGLTADQAKRLADATAAEAANTQFRQTFRSTRSFGSTFQSLSGIGSGASRLGIPGVGEALGGVSGVAEVAENLPRLRASLAALPDTIKNLVSQIGTPTLGLVGGLVLLAVFSSKLAEADKARADASNTLLDSQAKYFTLVQTATSESLTSARQSLQDKLNAEKANNDLLLNERIQLTRDLATQLPGGPTIFTTITRDVVELGKTLGLSGGEIKVLDAKIKTSDESIGGFNKELTDNATASHSAQVALNDLTLAESRRADKLIADATGQLSLTQQLSALKDQDAASLRKQKESLIEANAAIADAQRGLGTIPMLPADQKNPLKDQFDAWQKEIDNNKTIIDAISGTYLTEAQNAENAKQAKLEYISSLGMEFDAQRQLNSILRGNAEAAGQRIQDITDEEQVLKNYQYELLQSGKDFNDSSGNLTDAGKQFLANNQQIVALERNLTDIRASGAALLLRSYQDLETSLTDLWFKLQEQTTAADQDLVDKNKSANDKAAEDDGKALDKKHSDEAKADKDFNDKEVDLDKSHKDRLQKIGEDAAQGIEDAIRGRNAAAAITAIRAANKARRDEDKSYKDAQDKLVKSRKDQQDTIDQSYKEQLKTIDDTLKKQLQDNQAAHDKTIRQDQEAYGQEYQAKVLAYNTSIRQLQSFLNNQQQLTSEQQANQLLDQFNFNYRAGQLFGQFVDGGIAWLQRLADSVTGRTTGNIFPPTSGQQGFTLNTTVQVATGADPEAIAAAITKKQAALIKRVAGRISIQQ